MKAPGWMKTTVDTKRGMMTIKVRRWHPGFWWFALKRLMACETLIPYRTLAAPLIDARVGNIQIHADHHGMGFSCVIDGQPVKLLRSVTLRLEVDQPNIVTIEVLPDHRNKEPSRNA